MAFAVVACSGCKQPWSVDLRHRTVSCPHCHKKADLARRRRLWEGGSADEARVATAALRSSLAQGLPLEAAEATLRRAAPERAVRHDSPIDAAAAQARSITNLSARAEEVAAWLTRLLGPCPHEVYLEALGKAGIPSERAEREIVRMLARDIVYEPRAGSYAALAI